MIVGAAEKLVNSEVAQKAGEVVSVMHDALREGVKKGTEVVHGATRAMNAADGVPSDGLPAIEDADEVAEGYRDAIKTLEDTLPDAAGELADALKENSILNAVDPSGAAGEVVEQVGETLAGVVGGEVVEEVVETVAEVVPGVGVIGPSVHLIHGTGKATAGLSSLLTGGVLAIVGGVYGAVAAPFDGGAAWGKIMNVSRKSSAWGASMGAEGGLIAAKGAVGYANQVCAQSFFSPPGLFRDVVVRILTLSIPAGGWALAMARNLVDVFSCTYQVPGSQVATIPAKVACKLGANWLNRQRNTR